MRAKTERNSPVVLKFNRLLAKEIGLNEAILVSQLEYWTGKIPDDDPFKVDDLGWKWTYNSYREWQEQFPFWSERTIRRTMDSLMDKSLVISQSRGRKHSKTGVKWSNEYCLCTRELQRYLNKISEARYGQSDRVSTNSILEEEVSVFDTPAKSVPSPDSRQGQFDHVKPFGTTNVTVPISDDEPNSSPEIRPVQNDLLSTKSKIDNYATLGQVDQVKAFEGGQIDPLLPEDTKNTKSHSNISTRELAKTRETREQPHGEREQVCPPTTRRDDQIIPMSSNSTRIEAIDVTADLYRKLEVENEKALAPYAHLIKEEFKYGGPVF